MLGDLNGSLSWATPLVIAGAGASAVLLALTLSPRARAVILGVAIAVLLGAPAVWAADTVGHATNDTFPTGGPASAAIGGPGGFGGQRGFGRPAGGFGGQGTAAAVIISSDPNVAGLVGFSGRESTVSLAWLAQEVSSGHLRWILTDGTGGSQIPGDTLAAARARSTPPLKCVGQRRCRGARGFRARCMTATDALRRSSKPRRASDR